MRFSQCVPLTGPMNRPLFMQKAPELLQASAIKGLFPPIAIHRATASVHVMANIGAVVDRQGKITRSKRKMSTLWFLESLAEKRPQPVSILHRLAQPLGLTLIGVKFLGCLTRRKR